MPGLTSDQEPAVKTKLSKSKTEPKKTKKRISSDDDDEVVVVKKRKVENVDAVVVKKNEEPSSGSDSERAAEFMAKHSIKLSEKDLPPCYLDFSALPYHLSTLLTKVGYTAPTPIQAQAWPILRQGRDIVAVAKTGSGKTCGFLVPAIMHVQAKRQKGRYGDAPITLVLAPTRELANQIETEANKFCGELNLRATCVYGGVPRGPQIGGCRQGADILIATPGRLLDFEGFKQVKLDQVSYLVLDEADRMLDMGFEADMRKIIGLLPEHQTVFFTATWPKEVRKIATEFSKNAVQVHIGDTSNQLVASTNVTQIVHVMTEDEKKDRLHSLLLQDGGAIGGSKTIIFTRTKRNCDWLARTLRQGRFSAQALHGDMAQEDRDWVLQEFRSNRLNLLVATDVAARGLDVKDIKTVVNFDFPNTMEDYIHRIGRTGRVDAVGVAYSFFTEETNKAHAAELVKIMKNAKQEVPPELQSVALKNSGYGNKKGGNWRGGSGGWRGGRGGGYGGRGGYGGGRGGNGGRGGFRKY
eukprot:comp19754_c0_seq1/m.23603 comp19754_c0_seq1/g.23603  ORF comp19754_c0_seq1/g.23603 comp19754_c0_seq1/m.23603 type:complete len:525 (-) comp19754_c0_seq1:297-1871(-)